MPDELDTILDEAIQSYSAVEPSPDLAGRILYKSKLQTILPQRGWKLAFAFALSFAAAVALAFVLLGPWSLPKPPATVATAPTTPSVVQPARRFAIAAESVQTHRKVRKAAGRNSWGRPLPPPYSKEELSLLNFVQQHPKEAAEIAESQEQDSAPLESQPITISHLEIKPLSIAPLR